MSVIPIIKNAADEVDFLIKYFTEHFPEYDASGLANGNVPTNPSIQGVHPLAMEYGERMSGSEAGDYQTYLPAIGVELTEDAPNAQQLMGQGMESVSVDQAFVDQVRGTHPRDRIAEGNMVSDNRLDDIQAIISSAADDKARGRSFRYIDDQTVLVSIWSYDLTVTKIYYKIVKSLLKRAERELSAAGVKNMTTRGKHGLYNYDFDRTLFGAEFVVNWKQPFVNIEIDESVKSLSGEVQLEVENGIPDRGNVTIKGVPKNSG